MRIRSISISVIITLGLTQSALAQQMISEPPPVPRPSATAQMRDGTTVWPVRSDNDQIPHNEPQGWTPSVGLQIREDRGVRYVSGGIGISEREELNALSSQFNLRLMLAVQAGNFVSDAQITITNQRGEPVLSAQAEGPLFFAQLPPGSYNVVAETKGESQRQTVRVNAGRQSRLNFFWRN